MNYCTFVRACYRSLLRWSRAAERIPFRVKKEHLRLVSPDLAEAKVTIQDAVTFRNVSTLVGDAVRDVSLQEAAAKEALSRAVLSLKLLNTNYAQQLAETEKKRRDHSNLHGIHFSIGQVVRHVRDGYRGVVYGWDRICRHPQYVTDPNIDFVQPFYSIIPDENDAIRSFGGPRMLQYVAQENLQSLEEPFKVANRQILLHFESYSPRHGRYLPKPGLRYEYPGEYCQEGELQPCEGTVADIREELPKNPEKTCRRPRPQKKSRRYTKLWSPTNTAKDRRREIPKVKGTTDKAT